MSDTPDLEAAVVQARIARARLIETAHELQDRLEPSRLFDDAVGSVKSGATELARTTADAARRQPEVAAGVAAAGLLLLVRKPLWRLGRRIGGRRRKPGD